MYPHLEKQQSAGSSIPPPGSSDIYDSPLQKPTAEAPSSGPQVAVGVPVVEPQAILRRQLEPSGKWSTGLFDCLDDIDSCCLGCWCPCVAFGQLSEIVDEGNSSCCVNGSLYFGLCMVGVVGAVFGVPLGCHWMYSCTYRGKIKKGLGMPPTDNCCVHFCCEGLALCQEYREIQNQGYILPLGWDGNQERFRQEGQNGTPPVTLSMSR